MPSLCGEAYEAYYNGWNGGTIREKGMMQQLDFLDQGFAAQELMTLELPNSHHDNFSREFMSLEQLSRNQGNYPQDEWKPESNNLDDLKNIEEECLEREG
ncbi:unnamed protein product [Penicillium glandicola]